MSGTGAPPLPVPPRALVLAAACLVATYVAFFAGGFLVGAWLLLPDGTLARIDFLAFWTAGRLALAGHAAAAYDPPFFIAAYEAAGGTGFDLPLGWRNPPSALLLFAPFGLLPYVPALLLWLLLTALFFVHAIGMVLPGMRGAGLVALAFPATVLCVWQGQNALLVAALFGVAFARLETAPMLAGVMIGLISLKPHFGVLLPLLLALGGYWRCFAAAAATVIVAVILSAAAFGFEAWIAFPPSLLASRDAYLGHFVPDTLQTVYGLVARAAGAGTLAWAAHGVVAVAVATIAASLWYRRASIEVRAASAIAAAFLVPPFAFPYDTVAVTVGAAFLARAAWRHALSRGEIALLALTCCVPALGLFMRSGAYGLVAYGLLMALAVRRHLAETRDPRCVPPRLNPSHL